MTIEWQINPVNIQLIPSIQQHIDQKTKPMGALGQLEAVALQIALIQEHSRLSIERPLMLVFAADHGIADEGVSIAPSSVTQQMVLNFLAGGAAINCFCRTNHLPLKVIDAGIKNEISFPPATLINQRIAAGDLHAAFLQHHKGFIDCARGCNAGVLQYLHGPLSCFGAKVAAVIVGDAH